MTNAQNTADLTIGELPFGTVILYNDYSNVDTPYMILGHFEDQFGKWVQVLNEQMGIEHMKPYNKLGTRFTIKQD